MVETRVIICAAGESTRWKNHTGVPKHLVSIRGEPLIHRTVRQFSSRYSDVLLLCNDPRYVAHGVTMVTSQETIFDGTALGHSFSFWREDRHNLIVLGDVVFSDAGVEIISKSVPDVITFFGRLGRDPKTKHGSEVFAIFIPVNHIDEMKSHIQAVKNARESGIINRHAGWEVHKSLNGYPIAGSDYARYKKNFVQILDFTDDFDYPQDYDRWIKEYGQI